LKGESVGRVGGDRGVVVDAFEGVNVRREMGERAVKGGSPDSLGPFRLSARSVGPPEMVLKERKEYLLHPAYAEY
jgi:hypothetical protein